MLGLKLIFVREADPKALFDNMVWVIKHTYRCQWYVGLDVPDYIYLPRNFLPSFKFDDSAFLCHFERKLHFTATQSTQATLNHTDYFTFYTNEHMRSSNFIAKTTPMRTKEKYMFSNL